LDTGRKGQTSLEFLVMLTMMLLVFTAMVSVINRRRNSLSDQRVSLQGVSVADRIGYELDMALVQGDGYHHGFDLRKFIGSHEYSINVEEGYIRVNWTDKNVFSSTAVQNLSGDIEPGYNRIMNDEGQIKVVG